jgi:hypothetical protein
MGEVPPDAHQGSLPSDVQLMAPQPGSLSILSARPLAGLKHILSILKNKNAFRLSLVPWMRLPSIRAETFDNAPLIAPLAAQLACSPCPRAVRRTEGSGELPSLCSVKTPQGISKLETLVRRGSFFRSFIRGRNLHLVLLMLTGPHLSGILVAEKECDY